MKAYFFEDTKIRDNQVFRNKEQLNNYLNYIDNNFLLTNLENWKDINSILKPTSISCSLILDLKTVSLDAQFVVIQNYTGLKVEFSYWNIWKTQTINNNQVEIFLKINLLSTYPLWDLFPQQAPEVMISRSHISEKLEFFDINNLILKDNNFFQRQQFISSDLDQIEIKKRDKIYTTREKEILKNCRFSKWAVIFADSKILQDSTDKTTNYHLDSDFYEEGLNGTIEREIVIFYIPLVESIKVGIQYAPGYAITYEDIEGHKAYNEISKNTYTISSIIIDFPPTSIAESTSIDKIRFLWYENEETVEFSPGVETVLLDGGTKVIRATRISKDTTTNIIEAESDFFFKWEIPTDEWLGDNKWNLNQELILNFSPFSNFGIGMMAESNATGWNFSFNNFKKLPNDETFIFFNRTLAMVEYSFSYLDQISTNYLQGEIASKTQRSFQAPLSTDAWQEYEKNKSLNGAQDFLMPAIGLGLATLIPGGLGAAALVGGGVKTTNTILNRKNIQNKPDIQSNTATSFLQEAIFDFSTKAVTKKTYNETDKKTIAYDFHKYGYNLFYESKKIWTMAYKTRFNYLQISPLSEIFIFNKNKCTTNSFILNEILEALKSGIHFWEFNNSWSNDLKDECFSFEWKNPIKGFNPIKTKDFIDVKLDHKKLRIAIKQNQQEINKIDSTITDLKTYKKQQKLFNKIDNLESKKTKK